MGRSQVVRQRVLVPPLLGSNPSGPVLYSAPVTHCPLLVLDLDGVIVDGMQEYWRSARRACLKLAEGISLRPLPEEVPNVFRYLRPWVHHGWEMVLIAAEIARPDSCLERWGLSSFCADYLSCCKEALRSWGQKPQQLQDALDEVRRSAIEADRSAWVKLHQPYPYVVQRLLKLDEDGVEWAVLTTKGTVFTAELLNSLGLAPTKLYGREDGPKVEILLQLALDQPLIGFVEDRRATLEIVRATKELHDLRCYLASWGYLRPEDSYLLPPGVRLLSLKTLMTPLTSWP